MAISTFGGSSPTSVTSNSRIVGEAIQVPVGFSTPGYVDAGASFSAATYPALAAAMPPSFQADLWSKVSIPTFASTISTSAYGFPLTGFTFNGDFYFLTQKGYLFGTTGGVFSSLAFIKQLPLPPTATSSSNISYSNVVNGKIYVTWNLTTNGGQIFNDATFSNPTLFNVLYSGGYNTIKYFNGTYWASAASTGNTLYKSTDGINWSSFTTSLSGSSSIVGLDVGNNTIVAMSAASTSNVITSTDGTNWTLRSGPAVAINKMAFGGVNFICAPSTASTSIYTSPDGITWTPRTLPASVSIGAITGTPGGLTYASGSGIAAFSGDGGQTWVAKTTFFTTTALQIKSSWTVNPFGETFVITGNSTGTPQPCCLQTTDNFTTVATNIPLVANVGGANLMPPVVFNNSIYSFEKSNVYGYSAAQGVVGNASGTSWSQSVALPNLTVTWSGITNTTTKLIAYGAGSGTLTGFYVSNSTDGINWTTNFSATVPTTYTVISSGETLIAYLAAGSTTYYTSTDYGASWITRTAPVSGVFWQGVTSNAIMIAGLSSSCAFSIDGGITFTTGTQAASPGTPTGMAIGSKGNIMVFGLSTTSYLQSIDNGATWLLKTFPFALTAKGIIYTNGYYIVMMANGAYVYSTDGTNWTLGTTTNNPQTAQNWSSFIGGSNPILFNPLVGTVGVASSCAIPDTSSYRVPYMASPAAGVKYVVKAQ